MLTPFYKTLEELYRLECISALLNWDQQVMMPKLGGSSRTDQLELVARLMHERMVDPVFVKLVKGLDQESGTLSPDDRVNVRETVRSVNRALQLPIEFVAERTRVHAEAFEAWSAARPRNDFAAVLPHLTAVVRLAREEASLRGMGANAYASHLDLYEPGADPKVIRALLTRLASRIRENLPRISERSARWTDLPGTFPIAEQERLNHRVLTDIGYSFESGRLDRSAHPFSTTIGKADHRVTTRYGERFIDSLLTSLHEAGHALYSSGGLERHKGTPMGSAVSYGIHESQSRLWENLIGRSMPFCRYLERLVPKFFSDRSAPVTARGIYEETNQVRPSLIRVESDEVTYSLHIVIRMELEEGLLDGSLQVSDLPTAWGDRYEHYLGLRPKSDREGVLQDVHWYSGAIGYFPSYALGNLYGAQMMQKIRSELTELDAQIEAGTFAPLLSWLRKNVHEQGMRFQAFPLVKDICGTEVSELPFVEYLEKKYLSS